VELIKHLLGVGLECLREQVVQVRLVLSVNLRDGNGAAITGLARACLHAGLLVGALINHGYSRSGALFNL